MMAYNCPSNWRSQRKKQDVVVAVCSFRTDAITKQQKVDRTITKCQKTHTHVSVYYGYIVCYLYDKHSGYE